MCLRLARNVKSTKSRSPSTAPINAAETALLSNDRLPRPAIRKPQYAIATVQRIRRRLLIGPTSTCTEILTNLFVRGGLWHDFRPIIAMILGHQDFPLDKGTIPAIPRVARLPDSEANKGRKLAQSPATSINTSAFPSYPTQDTHLNNRGETPIDLFPDWQSSLADLCGEAGSGNGGPNEHYPIAGRP